MYEQCSMSSFVYLLQIESPAGTHPGPASMAEQSTAARSQRLLPLMLQMKPASCHRGQQLGPEVLKLNAGSRHSL